MHVILFGFKGSGKTYWGKHLAKKLAMPFVDTDQCIIDLYGKRLSCRDIHQTLGETAFRELEHQAIISLIGLSRASVVALGGGTILFPENKSLLEKMGTLIYLKTSQQTLRKRLLNNPLPSFLDPQAPDASFNTYYENRLPLYQMISAPSIDVEQEPVMERFKELIVYGK